MLLEKIMNIKNSLLDYIRYKQLNWYGHVQRMDRITFIITAVIIIVIIIIVIVKNTVTYGAETWKFNKNLESKLMSMEMDFLRRSARCSRLEKN